MSSSDETNIGSSNQQLTLFDDCLASNEKEGGANDIGRNRHTSVSPLVEANVEITSGAGFDLCPFESRCSVCEAFTRRIDLNIDAFLCSECCESEKRDAK